MTDIVVAVSACLLGEKVRHDGGDVTDRYVVETLGSRFTLLPVCPETGVGLPVPRPPIELIGPADDRRAVDAATGAPDYTDRLVAFARTVVADFAHVDGHILKSKSPSCGMLDPPGIGLYTRELTTRWPLMPIIDEVGLADPARRAAWLTRVASRSRLRRGATEPR
jgi:uncharacterized protein YbbK (DUF523 family)